MLGAPTSWQSSKWSDDFFLNNNIKSPPKKERTAAFTKKKNNVRQTFIVLEEYPPNDNVHTRAGQGTDQDFSKVEIHLKKRKKRLTWNDIEWQQIKSNLNRYKIH